MADTDGGHAGTERQSSYGEHRFVEAHGCDGFWSDAEWIACRDGKLRPVEPGTFPLVDWTSSRMGRLRAYGNAIVAPCAEAFIRAYLTEEIELREAA
jgi:DNA (cytosine-5)-methyltransferase 1